MAPTVRPSPAAAAAAAEILASLDGTITLALELADAAERDGALYHLVTTDLLALYQADPATIRVSALLASPLTFLMRAQADLLARQWNSEVVGEANQVTVMRRRPALLAMVDKLAALRSNVAAIAAAA